jgi:hypothetical protein
VTVTASNQAAANEKQLQQQASTVTPISPTQNEHETPRSDPDNKEVTDESGADFDEEWVVGDQADDDEVSTSEEEKEEVPPLPRRSLRDHSMTERKRDWFALDSGLIEFDSDEE